MIGREVEESQAGHGAQGSQQFGSTAIPQAVPCQAQLPERRVQLEGPQQRGELSLVQGQAAGADRGAQALALHSLQHLWVLPWKGIWCHQGQRLPICWELWR